jgi:hypothetical protein
VHQIVKRNKHVYFCEEIGIFPIWGSQYTWAEIDLWCGNFWRPSWVWDVLTLFTDREFGEWDGLQTDSVLAPGANHINTDLLFSGNLRVPLSSAVASTILWKNGSWTSGALRQLSGIINYS